MMIEHLSPVRDEDRGIPETAERDGRAFIEADVREDLRVRAGLPEERDLRAAGHEGLRREALEVRVVAYGRGEGRPEGEGREVGFREDDQIGAVPRRFSDQADGLLHRLRRVEPNRRDVAGCGSTLACCYPCAERGRLRITGYAHLGKPRRH